MSAAPVRRATLVQAQLASPPFGDRRFTTEEPPVRVGVTGSGDDLLLLAWSARDLACEVDAGARLFRRLGVAAGTRVANTLPGALATPGALLLGDVHEAIGALDVPLGVPDTDAAAKAAWELIDRVRCDVLVLDPATAPRLFGMMPPDERPWWSGIVWLQRGGAALQADAPAAFGGWQRRWLAIPEIACFAGATCASDRMHLDDGLDVRIEDGALVIARREAGAPAHATEIEARLATACECGAPGPVLAR